MLALASTARLPNARASGEIILEKKHIAVPTRIYHLIF